MDFLSDLKLAIVSEFQRQGISFPESADLDHLASRYLEMRICRIEPVPRKVHFSAEIHDSLGNLSRETDPKVRGKALEAWGRVFYLRHLFESGDTVMPFLSREVNNTEPKKPDGLLWDYAMHHLHLSRDVDKSGFVKRSDWLLFAIVADQDVFFIDVRKHKDPERQGFEWVRQDLLDIVHNNWPELTESRLLHGVTGSEVTNAEKLELRRKNVNLAHKVGGRVIAPLGFGTAGDGHSILCRFLADKLLHELEEHQRILESSPAELRATFVENGMPEDAEMDFKLVRRAELDVSEDLDAKMCAVEGFSGTLWLGGFAVIETYTRSLIVVDTQPEDTNESRRIEGRFTMDNTVHIRINMIPRANPEHLKVLLTGVSSWNRKRAEEDFEPLLMGAQIYEEFAKANKLEAGEIPLSYANLRDAQLFKANLTNANLESAQLQGANLFNVKLEGATLSFAQLEHSTLEWALLQRANLLRANLGGANLQGARLNEAHLVEANLSEANLRDGEEFPTELFGANLAGAQLWKAKLYPPSDRGGEELKELKSEFKEIPNVDSLLGLCGILSDRYSTEKYAFYFRGDNKHCELRPSVLRLEGKEPRKEEGGMLRDLMSRRPEDFSDSTSALDQWVLARHYGLKTRLLDITRNPLVALFHACFAPDAQTTAEKPPGRLHVFAVPKDLVKPFDSDTISVIANFAKLRVAEQNLLLGMRQEDVREGEEIATADKHSSAMLRMNQFIKQEKPYFEDRMEPRDLYRIFVVEPRQTFDRIRAQSAAFLISAFHERFEQDHILKWNEDIPVYEYFSVEVPGQQKEDILRQLQLLDITYERLYPGLDAAAAAVNEHNFPTRNSRNRAAVGDDSVPEPEGNGREQQATA